MRSLIQHLRFPFSYLLLPVFLMAFLITSHFAIIQMEQALLLFFILHLLVYPSSNAYNSLQDQDEGSIGLIKQPLRADKRLVTISFLFDVVAIGLSFIISWKTALAIFIYIAVSRLYSYRKIRLKQYPIIGFLVVFVFQGAWIYYLVSLSLGDRFTITLNGYHHWAFAASCLIGSIYPLSQVYQHDQDKADGVKTISYLLGKKGTFIFSGILFALGTISFLYGAHLQHDDSLKYFYLVLQLPSITYFNYWFYKVIKDESQANFKHTMRMSLISATCMNAFFGYLLFQNW